MGPPQSVPPESVLRAGRAAVAVVPKPESEVVQGCSVGVGPPIGPGGMARKRAILTFIVSIRRFGVKPFPTSLGHPEGYGDCSKNAGLVGAKAGIVDCRVFRAPPRIWAMIGIVKPAESVTSMSRLRLPEFAGMGQVRQVDRAAWIQPVVAAGSLVALLLASGARAGEVSATQGPLDLGTKVNGVAGGRCHSGQCLSLIHI